MRKTGYWFYLVFYLIFMWFLYNFILCLYGCMWCLYDFIWILCDFTWFVFDFMSFLCNFMQFLYDLTWFLFDFIWFWSDFIGLSVWLLLESLLSLLHPHEKIITESNRPFSNGPAGKSLSEIRLSMLQDMKPVVPWHFEPKYPQHWLSDVTYWFVCNIDRWISIADAQLLPILMTVDKSCYIFSHGTAKLRCASPAQKAARQHMCMYKVE